MKTLFCFLTALLIFKPKVSASELKIGMLYCPELKVTDQVPEKIPTCPLLIAGFLPTAGTALIHVIDSHSHHYYIPSPLAITGQTAHADHTGFKTWPTNFSGTLKGALDSNFSVMVGVRHPGVSRPIAMANLRIMEKASEDTVPLSNLSSSLKSSLPATTASACLDTLASQSYYGHVNGKFLPGRLCEFTINRYYQVAANGTTSLADSSKLMSINGLYATAKPFTIKGNKPDWIWADFSTPQGSLWLFRQPGRPDLALLMDTSEVPETESIRVEDLNGDGFKEFLFTNAYHYGDGDYQILILFEISKAGKPAVWQSGIGGSSGEAGGSTVVADWWITSSTKSKNKRLHIATAQEGNEGGQSYDMQIQAYNMTPQISIVKQKHFFVALFGKPESKHLALERMSVIGMLPTKPDALELRVLPRFTDSGLQWQTGALAPDAKTARAWAKLEKTGKVFQTKTQ
jgi:hypothetical protein